MYYHELGAQARTIGTHIKILASFKFNYEVGSILHSKKSTTFQYLMKLQ